jgi:hypothetical protein
MYDEIFYYDYHRHHGGIFPSLSRAGTRQVLESALRPSTSSVRHQDAITVRMSRQDDPGLCEGVSGCLRRRAAPTCIVELDVTLRAGSARVELGTHTHQYPNSAVPEFEYWTVTHARRPARLLDKPPSR